MPKFKIKLIDNYYNDGKDYYYISFSDERYDGSEVIAKELGIPFEDYIYICKNNGGIILGGFTNVEDVFSNIYQANSALQELLEFSIEYNKNNCNYKIEVEDKENEYLIVPQYPQGYYDFTNGLDIGNEQINKWVAECVEYLEEENEDFTYKKSGNTAVFVCKMGVCEDCEEYYYNIFVCKNYQEYDGIKDLKCKNCNKERK